MYFQEMGRVPLLSAEEEIELARAIAEGQVKLREVVFRSYTSIERAFEQARRELAQVVAAQPANYQARALLGVSMVLPPGHRLSAQGVDPRRYLERLLPSLAGADKSPRDGVYVKAAGGEGGLQSVQHKGHTLSLGPECLRQLRCHGDRVQIRRLGV